MDPTGPGCDPAARCSSSDVDCQLVKKKVDDTIPTKLFKQYGWFIPSLWQMVDWGDFDPGLTFAQNVALYYRARCDDMTQYGCTEIAQFYDHWSGLSAIPENPCGIMTLCGDLPWLFAALGGAGATTELSSIALMGDSEESVLQQSLGCGDVCEGISTERELQMGRMLSKAAQNKGFSGIGSGTQAEAEIMGQAWVGPDYRVAGGGNILVSKDGLRQFRFPSFKPNRPAIYGGPGYQANFEWRRVPYGEWQSDAHLDITDMQ